MKQTALVVEHEQLHCDFAENVREYYLDLPEIGASLDAEGQIVPLFVLPLPGQFARRGEGSEKWPMYELLDGYTRYKSVADGFAPHFRKKGKWKVIVVTADDGSVPPLDEALRYAASVNRLRRNWGPLEEGTRYRRVINFRLSQALAEARVDRPSLKALDAATARQVEQQAVDDLAQQDQCNANTVREKLQLLDLAPQVQKALAYGLLNVKSAIYFVDKTPQQAAELLRKAAEFRGINIEQRLAVPRSAPAHGAVPTPGSHAVAKVPRHTSRTSTVQAALVAEPELQLQDASSVSTVELVSAPAPKTEASAPAKAPAKASAKPTPAIDLGTLKKVQVAQTASEKPKPATKPAAKPVAKPAAKPVAKSIEAPDKLRSLSDFRSALSKYQKEGNADLVQLLLWALGRSPKLP